MAHYVPIPKDLNDIKEKFIMGFTKRQVICFGISLCEIIVGGRYGLSSEERSIIDKCVQRIYKNFIENEPAVEKMPLLSDLQRELKNEGEVALRVSNSLEMFVNGSQNLFNHRTNIDMTNRIICFDIKELGNQLKKVGMLIVQDTVWNRVSANREKKKITRYPCESGFL